MGEKRKVPQSLASEVPPPTSKVTRRAPLDRPAPSQAISSHEGPSRDRLRAPVFRKATVQIPSAAGSIRLGGPRLYDYPKETPRSNKPAVPPRSNDLGGTPRTKDPGVTPRTKGPGTPPRSKDRGAAPPHSKDRTRFRYPAPPSVPLAQPMSLKPSHSRIPLDFGNALKVRTPGQNHANVTARPKKAGIPPKSDAQKEYRKEGAPIRQTGGGLKPKALIVEGGDHQNHPRFGINLELSTPEGGDRTKLPSEERAGIMTSQANVESFEDLQEQNRKLLQECEDLKAEVAALKLRISNIEGPGSSRDSPLFVPQTHVSRLGGTVDDNPDSPLFVPQSPLGEATPEGTDAIESPPGAQESEDEVDENLQAGLEEGRATMEGLEKEEPTYEPCQREKLELLTRGGRSPRSARLSDQSPPDYCYDSVIR